MTITNEIVTRFDIFTRIDEENGDREVVRLFNKRRLVLEIDLDDVVREEWEDDLKAKLPLAPGEVLDFLGEEAEEEEEDEEGAGGSIVPQKYRILYGAEQNCGDEMAIALTAYVTDGEGDLILENLVEVAAMNQIADRLARWVNKGLNGGLLRMNTGNVLRGKMRRGEAVAVGTKIWEAREVEKKPRKRNKAA